MSSRTAIKATARRRRNVGLRQVLGGGIIVASLVLSFLLVSCGNDPAAAASTNGQAAAQSESQNRNIPAQQATTAPITATTAPPAPGIDPNLGEVIVARRAIPVGAEILAEDLERVAKPRAEIDPNTDIINPADALGRITRVSYNAGQQIKRGDLVEGSFSNYMNQLVKERRLEPGKKAYAYPTNDVATVAGLIRENDLVDVVATYLVERRSNTAPTSTAPAPTVELTTKTILQNVRVLRVIRLQPRPPQEVPRPTPTPDPNSNTPTVAVAGPATPTPTPTLPPISETGAGFQINTLLVLAVTDQEAEVLKFTREYRAVGVGARLTGGPVIFGDALPNPNAFGDITSFAIPVVNFVLRPKPQDPTNLTDPALARESTSGVTFRVLVRDYGLPIPELVYATGTQ